MKWATRLKETPRTMRFQNGFGYETVNVYDVVLPSSSTKGAYQSRTKLHTSKAVGKKTPASTPKIWQLYVQGATRILRLILRSITPGKWIESVWRVLVGSFWRVIYIVSEIEWRKPSTGSKSSSKISTLDRLFAYGALTVLSAGFIRIEVMPYLAGRIVVVFLATGLILRIVKT